MFDTITAGKVATFAGHRGSVKTCSPWDACPGVLASGARDGCVQVPPALSHQLHPRGTQCIVNMTQYCQTGTAMTVEQYSIQEGSFLLQFVSISQPLASSCLSSAGVGCPTILWRRSSQPPWPASASTGSDNQGTHHMLPKMRYYDFLTVDLCGIRVKTVSKWGQDVHHPSRSD